ncbi:MAG: hypothetical protein NTX13_09915 [Acidobacteria bacterium]|nr:hypothetical protein [Acidobacteriota bacterium]
MEYQTWQEGFAALRTELERERSDRRSAEEQLILLQTTLEDVSVEPDPGRQSTAQTASGG